MPTEAEIEAAAEAKHQADRLWRCPTAEQYAEMILDAAERVRADTGQGHCALGQDCRCVSDLCRYWTHPNANQTGGDGEVS